MLLVKCPHCGDFIEIEQINCGIFRHGVYIRTGKQINPHASKIECDNLILNKEIYGCGLPFQIINNTVCKCDYI